MSAGVKQPLCMQAGGFGKSRRRWCCVELRLWKSTLHFWHSSVSIPSLQSLQRIVAQVSQLSQLYSCVNLLGLLTANVLERLLGSYSMAHCWLNAENEVVAIVARLVEFDAMAGGWMSTGKATNFWSVVVLFCTFVRLLSSSNVEINVVGSVVTHSEA